MNILKQSTAATIKIGPFVDDTDGKTAETGLTISQADIRLSKNGGDMAQTNNTAGATHDELGYYNVPLDATDTNTLGRLLVAVHKSGALPVWKEFLVVTANVYDTLCSTDSLDVNVTAMADDLITAGKFDESTAFPLKSADTGSTQVARVGADSDTLETLSDQLDAAATASALSTIDGKIDTIDNFLDTEVAAILEDTGTTIPATLATLATAAALDAVDNYVDTEVAAIKAKTDLIPASPAQTGEYTAAIAAIQADLDNPDQYKADVSTLATTAHVQEVEDKVDIVDGIADAILEDTGTDIPATLATLALESTLTAMKGAGWTTETLVTLKAYVDEIETRLTAARAGYLDKLNVTGTLAHSDAAATYKADVSGLAPANEYDAKLSAIQADLDNPAQYRADVSALMLASSYVAPNNAGITAIKAKTDNLPANTATALAAIQSDLDNPAQYKADVSGLATQASVNAIPTTPLLAANYTAPDNATIGEIKAKTDNIPATPLTAQQVWEYVTRTLTSQGSGGATAQEVWEYATRVLTAGTNIDLTPLAKTTHLQEVEDKVDGIKGITDQLTFTVPNKVDASATVDPTGIATSEGLDIIGEKVDGVLNKLNVSSVEFVTAVVGSNITILRGDTLAARLLDLGDLTQYASLDFTVKRVAGELDDAAKIRLRKNASGTDDGLLRINGAEYATATDGSIVIDDLTTGDIEIKLNAAATKELVPGNYVYDVQLIIANEVRTLTAGKLEVVADVTRAVA